MTKIRKRIFIVLVIVIALVRAIDVLCADDNSRDQSRVLNYGRGNSHNSAASVETTNQDANTLVRYYETAPTRGGHFKIISFGITIFLLIVAIVLTMGYSISTIVKPKREFVEKPQNMELSVNTPPIDAVDLLRSITQKLSIPLSHSTEIPPLDPTVTLPVTTSRASTEVNLVEQLTTDIMTTEDLATPSPGLECYDVARAVYDIIEEEVSNSMMNLLELDPNSAYSIEEIKKELNKTSKANCGNGFFKIVDLYCIDGLSFTYENDFVKAVIDNNVCKKTARKMIPVLYELGTFTTEVDCRATITSTLENRSLLVNTLEITQGKPCGGGFFTIEGFTVDSMIIEYKTTNYYISQEWKSFLAEPKCQAAADAVILVLYELRKRTYKVNVQNTILNSVNVRNRLIDGFNLAQDYDCGYGSINVVQNDDDVVVTYRNTNRFVIKAWKNIDLKNIPACETAVQEVLPFLRELNLFSPETDGSLVIPDEGQNIRTLIRKLASAEFVNCGDGFFTRVDENGLYKLKFNKENIHLKPHWV